MGLKLGSLTLGPQCLLIMSPRGGIWASTPLKPSAEHFLSDTNFKTCTLTFSYLIFSTTYLEPLLQTRKLLKSGHQAKEAQNPTTGPTKGPGLPGCRVSALVMDPHILPSLQSHPRPNTRHCTHQHQLQVQTACGRELWGESAGSPGPGKLASSATVQQTCETWMGLEATRGPSTNYMPVTRGQT